MTRPPLRKTEDLSWLPARPHLRHERAMRKRGYNCVAGVDEAGRGPLAGPVSVAAVVLPDGFKHKRLTDSKLLPPEDREAIFEELTQNERVLWHVVLVDVEEIDRFNILQATYMGMRRAITGLLQQPEAALIDGLPVPAFPVPHEALVKGDRRSFSIAAASVIAKVTRDRYMRSAAELHPQYGFERHKGYGTPEHLEALRQHGRCPLHRRSFSPVTQLTLDLDEI